MGDVMRDGIGGWSGWHLGWWLVVLTVLALLVAAAVVTLRGPREGRGDRSLDILEERYARGEIDRAEFEEARRTLRGR